jgi:hypothetical protein
MSRWVRSMTVLVGASAALFGGAVATAHQPVAHAAGHCSVGSGRGYGYTYLEVLTVQGTSCSTGKSIAKAHGRGWSCTKKRLSTSSVQYVEKESCSSGSRRAQWTYSQNT